jgi:hypothetical protein
LHRIAEIQSLVREYTLRTDKKDSTPARKLKKLTGYHLTPPVQAPGSNLRQIVASPICTRHAKAEAYRRFRMDLEQMDACKVRDAAMAHVVTECRVERSGGRYFYFTHDDVPVDPQDYASLYLAMIQKVSATRSNHWKEYFSSLQQQQQIKPSNDDTAVWNLDSSQVDAIATPAEGKALTPGTSKAPTPFALQVVATPVNRPVADSVANGDEASDPTPFFGLPDRDAPSSNEEIAQAEAKLWRSLDQALEEYSQEVLAILHRNKQASSTGDNKS